MMINLNLIILLFLINHINCFNRTNVFNDSNIIIPLVNEYNDILYLISGNETIKSIMNIYGSRNLENNEYLFENKFDNIEATFGGHNSDFLLVFYGNELKIYQGSDKTNFTYNNTYELFRGTLKNINSSYFYVSTNNEITKMELNLTKGEIISKKSIKFAENVKNLISVSCDFSRDYAYYICSYFYNENHFGISVFTNQLKLLTSKEYDTGSTNKKNFFNKIVYLKDDNKFISINSEKNNIIRLRYFEINDEKLNNLLNLEDNNRKDYLDIDGTQLNPYNYSNDIIAYEDDKIIKIFVDENNNLILSKIQFYKNDSIITVKTKKIENNNTSLSYINPRLIIWRNSLIISYGAKEMVSDQNYTTYFFSLGYPNAPNDIYINDNNNIILNKDLSMDSDFFSFKFYYKIIDIPTGFKIKNKLNNTNIKKGDYLDPERDELVFQQYQRLNNVSLKYQIISIGEYINDTFKIFPEKQVCPIESKIVSGGDYGKIYLYLDSCNNEYYDVEDEKAFEICSKVRPEGFYLNKGEQISFKKCYPSCSECITGSEDDTDMKCLNCIRSYYYDPRTFNCYSIHEIVEHNYVTIKREGNRLFWIFLSISILAILLAGFAIFNDKIIRRKVTSSTIEENETLIKDDENKIKEKQSIELQ